MITRERVLELLAYDPETGEFRWKVDRRGGLIKAGSPAGCVRRDGYRQIKIDGRRYLAHRLAWYMVYGTWPSMFIDHIDGNPSNNQISNLRDVPPVINQQNQRRAHAHNELKVMGVRRARSKNGFCAQIGVKGRYLHLGTFDTPEEAHQAYIEAKRRYHEGNTL